MRSRRCAFFIVFFALTATTVARADPTDGFIRAQMKAQNIPGLALAVVQDGKMQLESHQGRRLVRHGGGMPGFGAQFARYVDDRLTIIILINLDDADEDLIARGVAALYLPKGR